MATEKRLIDANAFKEFLENVRQDYIEENNFSSDFAACVIETVQDNYLALAPTVDAVEVVHGRWEKIIGVITPGGNPMVRCSVCKSRESEHLCYIASTPWHYCPNCGAKMDGEGDGNNENS